MILASSSFSDGCALGGFIVFLVMCAPFMVGLACLLDPDKKRRK